MGIAESRSVERDLYLCSTPYQADVLTGVFLDLTDRNSISLHHFQNPGLRAPLKIERGLNREEFEPMLIMLFANDSKAPLVTSLLIADLNCERPEVAKDYYWKSKTDHPSLVLMAQAGLLSNRSTDNIAVGRGIDCQIGRRIKGIDLGDDPLVKVYYYVNGMIQNYRKHMYGVFENQPLKVIGRG